MSARIPEYDTSWLDARFPCDAAARHPGLEAEAISMIKDLDPVVILDVGSGNGSNFRHFSPRLKKSQHWYCLERDPRLVEAMLKSAEAAAQKEGLSTDRTDDLVNIRDGKKEIILEAKSGSLIDPEAFIPLGDVHLVMANAVFDILSEGQFETFAAHLARYHLPLLATINYAGMSFEPELPGDMHWIGAYETHMRRPRPDGQGMGKDCSAVMYRILDGLGATVDLRPANWYLGPEQQQVQEFLLGFMEEALLETEEDAESTADLKSWLAARRQKLKEGGVHTRVRHFDLWAYWS